MQNHPAEEIRLNSMPTKFIKLLPSTHPLSPLPNLFYLKTHRAVLCFRHNLI